MGEGGTAVLRLPPETFARYQALRGNAPARSAAGTLQRVIVEPMVDPRSVAPRAQGQAFSSYSLQGIYFNPKQFHSVADCLTAASAEGLPLDLCK